MSGYDFDFFIKDDLQWVLQRFIRRVRRRWPKLYCGVELVVLSENGRLLEEYPEFFVVSRDFEMQTMASKSGLVGGESGESSFFVLLLPLVDGSVDVDVVTADARPFWFTEFVLECFSGAVFDWYRHRSMYRLATKTPFLAEVFADPEWMAQSIRTCVASKWPDAEIRVERTDVLDADVEAPWSLTVTQRQLDQAQEPQTAQFVIAPATLGRHGSLVGVLFPEGAERDWRNGGRAVLSNAVGLWHAVSFRSMRNPRIVFACPPGTPVLKNGLIEFEGVGGAVPDPVSRHRP